jgi:hypothetical protein
VACPRWLAGSQVERMTNRNDREAKRCSPADRAERLCLSAGPHFFRGYAPVGGTASRKLLATHGKAEPYRTVGGKAASLKDRSLLVRTTK